MIVIAIKEGFDGQVVRKPGDEAFEMPDGSKGSWFKPVDADPAPTRRKVKAEPPPAESDVA